MRNRRLLGIVLTLVLILFIPFTAMQFTDQVNWTILDFVVAGILLLGTGLVFELVIRKVTNKNYQITAIAVLLAVVFLFWAELAVGIFGNSFTGS